MSQYVLDLLRRDLETPSLRSWLARLKQREPVTGVDVVAALEAERRERDERLV